MTCLAELKYTSKDWGVAQCESACLASTRLWVQVPAPENKKKKIFLRNKVKLKPIAFNTVTIVYNIGGKCPISLNSDFSVPLSNFENDILSKQVEQGGS